MDVNREHPAFDLTLEVLVMLPCDPIFVKHADLVADLELPNQRKVTSICSELRQRGFDIISRNALRKKGRECCIARHTWRKAKAAAEEYWDLVYGETTDGETRTT